MYDLFTFVSVNIDTIEESIMTELRLTSIQAKIYVLVVRKGRLSSDDIAQNLGVAKKEAFEGASYLVQNGGFIEINSEFESMHPRFAIVNMYRRMCEREKIQFKKNLLVDNISIVLEKFYDDVRTKYKQL